MPSIVANVFLTLLLFKGDNPDAYMTLDMTWIYYGFP